MIRNRTATVNLDTPHGFEVRMSFEFYDKETGLPFDMAGKDVELEIYENNFTHVYGTDSGIGGDISIDGNSVDIIIPDTVSAYFDSIKEYPNKQYIYRIDIDQDYRLQGTWRSLQRAGIIQDQQDNIRVDVGSVVTSVEVASVNPGRVADLVRVMTASGSITTLDDTVILKPGDNQYMVATLPAPAEAFGNGASVPILLIRPADNWTTSTVVLSGTGPELPVNLVPGASVWMQSDGTDWHLIG